MKHLLKGAVATAIVLIVSIVISVFCNMKGINLDILYSAPPLAICAILIYHGLIRNEKDNQE